MTLIYTYRFNTLLICLWDCLHDDVLILSTFNIFILSKLSLNNFIRQSFNSWTISDCNTIINTPASQTLSSSVFERLVDNSIKLILPTIKLN